MDYNGLHNETELLSAFHQGNYQALHTVYELYLQQLCFFAEELTSDTQAAEDIAAECFIKAFQKRGDFASLEKLKAFLFVTARNASLDFLKGQKRHRLINEAVRQSVDSFAEDPEMVYLRAEAAQIIYAAIEKLPLQCATVVRLSVLEGKSIDEISAELHIAYKTVVNQKAKGLGLLRVALLKNKLLSPLLLQLALSVLNG